jgi:beta-glucosidase
VAAAARAKGIPVIVALVNGGPVDASLELANADAVVLVGYASQSAGDAFADVLFGDYAPAGKLTVTWPKSVNDLPSFSDMSMTTAPGRTYKYTSRVPLFPFGHGLSYTTCVDAFSSSQVIHTIFLHFMFRWTYSNLAVIGPGSNACNGAKVSVTLTNAGTVDSTEVVQVSTLSIS